MNTFMNGLGKHAPLKIIGMVLGGIVLATGLGLLLGMVIVWLWNALMPQIFGLPQIGYWQAVGLFVLGRLLIGGVRFGENSHRNENHHHRHHEKCSPDVPAQPVPENPAEPGENK